jgi:DNA-binding CsgD family transcriptional regulator
MLAACIDALALRIELGHRDGIAQSLEGAAAYLLAGDATAAATLAGSATALRERIGVPVPAADRATWDADVASARATLGEPAFDAAWVAGVALTPEDAVSFARRRSGPAAAPISRPERLRRPGSPDVLSTRELDVARLIGRGLSNIEIARRLAISERTVETHSRNIRDKLGLSTRAQLMAWTAQQGLLGDSE